MAHLTSRSAHLSLVERINRFPQGAPPSKLLFSILEMLFSEREAGLVALLPIKPFTARKAADIWKMKESEARCQLDELASRGILLDMEMRGKTRYVLPPPMAGFFEFSMMRIRGDIDQKLLAELFYEYLNVEEEFVKALFTDGETQLGRVFVHEPVLTNEEALTVLDYERASHVIDSARHISVGICYCRHKMQHLGRACDAPMEICMTFGNTARSLIRHGIAREVGKTEALDLLNVAYVACRAKIRFFKTGTHDKLFPESDARRLYGVRTVRRGMPGQGHRPCIGQQPGEARSQDCQGRPGGLSRMRCLRP